MTGSSFSWNPRGVQVRAGQTGEDGQADGCPLPQKWSGEAEARTCGVEDP